MSTTNVSSITTAALTAAVAPRWTPQSWAEHIAPQRHERHTANSYAKHAGEFPAAQRALYEALTIVRVVAWGALDVDGARELLRARVAARAARAAA